MVYNKIIRNIAYCDIRYNMRASSNNLKPQDIVILLKIIALGNQVWYHHTIAEDLGMSQSEVTQSLNRSRYAGLIDESRKKVNAIAFRDFLFHGLQYAFPQKPGGMVRGIRTAHSAPPLNEMIHSSEVYVWPYARGNEKGQAVEPLYSTAIKASLNDNKLYELLAMADALRVGRTREKELVKTEFKKILNVQ